MEEIQEPPLHVTEAPIKLHCQPCKRVRDHNIEDATRPQFDEASGEVLEKRYWYAQCAYCSERQDIPTSFDWDLNVTITARTRTVQAVTRLMAIAGEFGVEPGAHLFTTDNDELAINVAAKRLSEAVDLRKTVQDMKGTQEAITHA